MVRIGGTRKGEIKSAVLVLVTIASAFFVLTGCATTSRVPAGTGIGAGAGALLGYGLTGKPTGAAAGAGAGALAGALTGVIVDESRRPKSPTSRYSYGHHETVAPVDTYTEERVYTHPYHHGSYYDIPPGHLPPPGMCRIWYPGRPPGHQPPPGPCYRLRRHVPPGARLIYGSRY